MLKSFLLLSAAVLLAFAPAPSFGGAPQETAPAATPANPPAPTVVNPPAPIAANPLKPTPDVLAQGKKLYSLDCSMCHGDNGTGKSDLATSMNLTMADWTDPKALAGKQDGELFALIRSGKDKMPPEAAARAKDSEVWAVVLYIRNFSKGSMPAAAHP